MSAERVFVLVILAVVAIIFIFLLFKVVDDETASAAVAGLPFIRSRDWPSLR